MTSKLKDKRNLLSPDSTTESPTYPRDILNVDCWSLIKKFRPPIPEPLLEKSFNGIKNYDLNKIYSTNPRYIPRLLEQCLPMTTSPTPTPSSKPTQRNLETPPSSELEEIVGKNLTALLKLLEREKNPRRFKETILHIIQLYFDGLVEGEKNPDPEIWAEQSEAFDALWAGTRTTVSAYYGLGHYIPFDRVREKILPYSATLIKHGSRKNSKKRHLADNEITVTTCGISVNRKIKGSIDAIMPVASGGFEPAALLASYLDIKEVLPVRYSLLSRQDQAVLTPTSAPKEYIKESIDEKRILIVEDLVCYGNTIKKILTWIKEFSPSSIQVAVASGTKDKGGLQIENNCQYLCKIK